MSILYIDGLKGQRANSPGQRPGYRHTGKLALKGQKHYSSNYAFALTGRIYLCPFTQGDALGYKLIAPSGRTLC